MRQNKIQNLLFAFLLAITYVSFATDAANAGAGTATPTGTEQTAAPAQAATSAAATAGTAATAATTNSSAASSTNTAAPLPAPRAATGSQNGTNIGGKKSGIGNAIADLLAANPECAELSNNCQICIRKNASNVACSTPGIACARGTWSCTKIQINP